MTEVDPSQGQNEVKTEENAPINVKVRVSCISRCEARAPALVPTSISVCVRWLMWTVSTCFLAFYWRIQLVHGCTRLLAGAFTPTHAYAYAHRRLSPRRNDTQVVSSTGDEVFFKIKRNTKLSKLQGAYAAKVGKDVSSIR